MKTLVIGSRHVFLDRMRPDEAAVLEVRDGRIRRVRPYAELHGVAADARLAARTGADMEVRDFGDAFICSGFHDAHQHVLHTALFPSALADRYPGTSEADCVRRLRQFAAGQPRVAGSCGAGLSDAASRGTDWLISQGWRSDLWNPPVAPTRFSLDDVFPDRPVAMCSGDLHTLWLNGAGLRALGIGENDEPPAGGIFDRDEHGRLTGVLREAAGMLYTARVFQQIPREQLLGAYSDYFQRMLSQGVTSVCDMALSAVPGADNVREDLYEELLQTGRLPLRVSMFPQLVGDFERIEGLRKRLREQQCGGDQQFGGEQLHGREQQCGRERRVRSARGQMLSAPGMKQFFDGVSSAHTAWLTEPYANPRFPGDCGRPTVDPERMRELVMAAASRGIAVRIHTIGDRAIHVATDIFAEAYRRFGAPRDGANSLEHLENLLPGEIERLKAAHVVASVQPQHIVIDLSQPERDLGKRRAQIMWPFASYDRAGVPMAFGTDAPCVEPNSMEVLYCADERRDPKTGEPEGGWLASERVPMEVAIDAYTKGGAIVAGRSDELGTLAPGMLADLAVIDRDLMAPTSAEEILGARELATYVGGQLVWEA